MSVAEANAAIRQRQAEVESSHSSSTSDDDELLHAALADCGEPSQFIPDDTVVYEIYFTENQELGNISVGSEDGTLMALQAFAYNLSKDYIWHKEPFKLDFKVLFTPHERISERITFHYGASRPSYISGRTSFGGNTEDEWFIVYILMEISINFPQCLIRVFDNDGQFLLIEAAEHIPEWLEPKIAQRRVFIKNGSVIILPREAVWKSDFQRQVRNGAPFAWYRNFPSISNVEKPWEDFRASDDIQNVIRNRLSHFSTGNADQLHCATCVLPASLAALLHDHPTLISSAVHSYCRRDPFDLQTCSQKKLFPHKDLTTTQVRFTKYLYAMLTNQQCSPAKSSEWSLPDKNDEMFKANELGLKLTYGFEIFFHNQQWRPRREDDCSMDSDNNDQSEVHREILSKFLGALGTVGYFKDAQTGDEMNLCLARAELFFLQENFGTSAYYFRDAYDSYLMALPHKYGQADYEAIRAKNSSLNKNDDSWLTLNSEDFDEMLSKRYGATSRTKKSDERASGKRASSDMAEGSNGAAKGGNSVKPKPAMEEHFGAVASGTSKGIAFNADEFENSVSRMLDLHIPHSDSDSSDMESYGEEVLDMSLEEKNGSGSRPRAKKYRHFKAKGKPAVVAKVKPEPAVKPKNYRVSPGGDSIDFEEDEFTPVNIDKTLVSNILESYWPETAGQTSSSTTLLHGENKPSNGASASDK